MKTFHLIFLILIPCGLLYGQSVPADSLYFGQPRPGNIPQLFAPGKVSKPGRNEAVITFSPDGSKMVFYVQSATPYTLISTYTNDQWSEIDTIAYSAGRITGEPAFSSDGNKIYMFATQTVNAQGIADLSYSEFGLTGWSQPQSLGNPPNEENYQYHPCIVEDTSVYFSSADGEICRSQYNAGGYQSRIILPRPINFLSAPTWGDPYVTADESIMILKSIRPEGFGQNDLYISYRKSNRGWTNPKNLGNTINTAGDETAGDITPDGLYMTYGSNKDLYWVSTSFIDSLEQTNYLPYVLHPIANQTDTLNQVFEFIIPDSCFFDDDSNQTLSYQASLSNGSPLPSWLNFDATLRQFSGTPTNSGFWNILVKATDTEGAVAQSTFKITIIEPFGYEEDTTPDKSVIVFPNPVDHLLNVWLLKDQGKPAILQVMNVQGELVLEQKLCSETGIVLDQLPEGLYALRILLNNKVWQTKIVKSN